MKRVVLALGIVMGACQAAGAQQGPFRAWLQVEPIRTPHIDSVGAVSASSKVPLKAEDWIAAGMDALEDERAGFAYAVYGQLRGDDFVLLLVERTSAEETIHWGVLLDRDWTHVDRKMIAYDNAEGFMSVHSAIEADGIRIHTENVYAEPEASVTFHRMTGAGFVD